MSERLLVLVRHGQSEWNLKNLFTGWKDVDLTEKGVEEARAAGRKLKAQGLSFDVAFTSSLVRAQRTLDLLLAEMGQSGIPIHRDAALNERDYGDLVGMSTVVSAHGNSLRALVMVLERLSPDGILKRELATGVPIVYRLNADATVASKRDLAA